MSQPVFSSMKDYINVVLSLLCKSQAVDQQLVGVIMVTKLNLNILREKKNICADFGTTFKIRRVLKKQKTLITPQRS